MKGLSPKPNSPCKSYNTPNGNKNKYAHNAPNNQIFTLPISFSLPADFINLATPKQKPKMPPLLKEVLKQALCL